MNKFTIRCSTTFYLKHFLRYVLINIFHVSLSESVRNCKRFGKSLDSDVLDRAYDELEKCDICLVIGTSSVVYPVAMFAPQVAARGVPVAEFNMEHTPATKEFGFHFQGPCGSTLPSAIS